MRGTTPTRLSPGWTSFGTPTLSRPRGALVWAAAPASVSRVSVKGDLRPDGDRARMVVEPLALCSNRGRGRLRTPDAGRRLRRRGLPVARAPGGFRAPVSAVGPGPGRLAARWNRGR